MLNQEGKWKKENAVILWEKKPPVDWKTEQG